MPETPAGVNVGGVPVHVVPVPVKVTVHTLFSSIDGGETASVDVTSAGL